VAILCAGTLVLLNAQTPPRVAARPFSASSGGKKTVTLTEGTNVAATVSPDHKTIIICLQGVLYSLPMSGGKARAITDPLLDPARPDWSPKGDLVTFESYSGGTFHIWVMKPDGTGIKQLTTGHGDDRDPRFSPDGAKIAFSSDRAFKGSYDIWVVDVASGQLTQKTSGLDDEYEPAWSPDGKELAFVSGVGANGTTIRAIDASGMERTLMTTPAGAHVNSPSWTGDGKGVAWIQFAANKSILLVDGKQVGTKDDVFPFAPLWVAPDELLYTGNGHILVSKVGAGDTREIPFEARVSLDRPAWPMKKFDFDSGVAQPAKGIVGPALSPDGKRIVFEALNQLWLMEIGKKPEPLTNDAFYKTDAAWSPDGTKIAYSSDKAGTEDIYILDLATKAGKRVTTSSESAEFSAAWSPDGKMLAYQDQTGSTYTLDLVSGQSKKLIPAQFEPSKPSWGGGGKTVAIGAVKAYTRRFREGTSQILTADAATGALTFTEPAPFASLSTRGEDGPVYSPDRSSIAFVSGSVLWIRPVDASGVPAGPAKQITHEATDAPTWSGDSKRLLYLSNGKLRLVGVDGSAPQTIPLELTTKQDEPTGRVLIHAGRFWDGKGADVRTNVDILVVNNRIRSVSAHSDAAHKTDLVVDASSQTVIPGLWESHTHEWMSGKPYGDRLGRLWLAYGVTTLHSQGDPAYRSVETRESYASGARLGPRFFATGEAIDGERVYYNFMRPTTSEEQLKIELSRAQALGYDSLKTYVRLPHSMQKEVVQFAHGTMGVPVLSHYMLPGMAYGMDGISHVSATSRYGFAYTRSAAGVSYQDVMTLFPASGMSMISTSFSSSTLYSEDPSMVDDTRLKTLNTPWDEMALKAKAARSMDTDQKVTLDSLRKEEETVGAIVRAGGSLLAGTDSPIDNVATALHVNLRAQVKYGLAPWQALQTATLLPAKAFGVANDLGTLEPGKLADMVFISGDPLTNIKDVANVSSVMKNGKLYTLPELMKPFQK
jgi:Tol biopolymer transport system component